MSIYELDFSDGSKFRVEAAESLYGFRKTLNEIFMLYNGIAYIDDKLLNLYQLVSVRELEEWETDDNPT